MKIFLPVEVTRDKEKESWYIDITRLGISDLISLRKELTGVDDYSVAKLDGIIYSEIGYVYESANYENKFKRKENVKRKALKKYSKGKRK